MNTLLKNIVVNIIITGIEYVEILKMLKNTVLFQIILKKRYRIHIVS